MPELPEVELARQVLAGALGRKIRSVDDHDDWVCRPHAPGDIATALRGGRLTEAHRRGKTLWCETEGGDGRPGPNLGLHLGMAGQLRFAGESGPPGRIRDRDEKPEWFRFGITFADGEQLRLFDTRRLSRVRLDPDLDALGPDAGEISRRDFAERVGRGRAPLKARLLDQSVVAGIGNLLADETLWQAALSPARPVHEMSSDDLGHLHKALRKALRAAIRHGGVHTGEIIGHRRAGEHCPRCGAEMSHGTVGGRSTWWCSKEQS
ncbi:Fpg/Nei family DNA glycosylase [Amycolatopsis mediterranei]|uniref:Fpg/Nei family DNA glycosylase n=1 Tax=Amycolatopsis mediterranei TaxID=33910 RepID=UPI0002D58EDB|nr:DNA-formamidopyrimidine glycosylase family protein [Amycolatopsis mediterranei]KDO03948.1 formamidopyrimidine-DNA glycosylase [Amycolatopsis mediterranei]KDU94162.1 formamidopyrimidine-DNA glycosylase [Amycolatopsis mediterranei]UZF73725.1 formamidopyrimidine-DNA glycosylase [Amycolatopsis mediterranei]